MGYPMAGHLSKRNDLDLFVYNRTRKVTDSWLNQYKGSIFDLNNFPNFKFDGLIICLKDDNSIFDLLIRKKLFQCLKKNSFIVDHSTTSLELVNLIISNKEIVNQKLLFLIHQLAEESLSFKWFIIYVIGGPANKYSLIKN